MNHGGLTRAAAARFALTTKGIEVHGLDPVQVHPLWHGQQGGKTGSEPAPQGKVLPTP